MKKQEENFNQQPTRRPQQDDINPSILVSGPSTSTLVNEPLKDNLALKLNLFKEKYSRCESHEDVLSRCMRDRLIPNASKLELELTIGNNDQEFIGNWFSKLKYYCFDLMKEIIKFCDKTLVETKPIQNIQLKASME